VSAEDRLSEDELDVIPDRVLDHVIALTAHANATDELLLWLMDHTAHPDGPKKIEALMRRRWAYCVYCKHRHIVRTGCPAGIPYQPDGNGGFGVFGRNPGETT